MKLISSFPAFLIGWIIVLVISILMQNIDFALCRVVFLVFYRSCKALSTGFLIIAPGLCTLGLVVGENGLPFI